MLDKTKTIQRDHIKTLTLDNGTERDIYLINKDDIHTNSTQVINQYSRAVVPLSQRNSGTIAV